jgi:hypothetical protein
MRERPDFKMPEIKYYETDQNQDNSMLVLRSDLPVSTTEFPSIRSFISKTRDVSCLNYDLTIQGYYSGSTYIYYTFDFYGVEDFRSGETAFLIAYLYNEYDYGYFDPYLGFQVFPTIDPQKHSLVIEIKIP